MLVVVSMWCYGIKIVGFTDTFGRSTFKLLWTHLMRRKNKKVVNG